MIRFAVDDHRRATPLLALAFTVAIGACASDEPDGEPAAGADTAATAAPATDTPGFSVADVGLQAPESVLHDEAADVYLVSNINGASLDKDDNGFITRLSPDGQVTELRWIDGQTEGVTLHAPKGMAIKGDSLFVTDIDSVRIFDRNTGAPLGARGVPGATFLNDAAVGPEGTLYVTDSGLQAGAQESEPSGTDAVYRFGPDGQAVAVAEGPELNRPNGIDVDDAGVVVVSFGGAEIYRIDPSGARTVVDTLPTGRLDGVVQLDDGSLLVSSWEGRSVYRVRPAGQAETVVSDVESPADIGYDARRGRVLIPLLTQNRVEVRPVP